MRINPFKAFLARRADRQQTPAAADAQPRATERPGRLARTEAVGARLGRPPGRHAEPDDPGGDAQPLSARSDSEHSFASDAATARTEETVPRDNRTVASHLIPPRSEIAPTQPLGGGDSGLQLRGQPNGMPLAPHHFPPRPIPPYQGGAPASAQGAQHQVAPPGRAVAGDPTSVAAREAPGAETFNDLLFTALAGLTGQHESKLEDFRDAVGPHNLEIVGLLQRIYEQPAHSLPRAVVDAANVTNGTAGQLVNNLADFLMNSTTPNASGQGQSGTESLAPAPVLVSLATLDGVQMALAGSSADEWLDLNLPQAQKEKIASIVQDLSVAKMSDIEPEVLSAVLEAHDNPAVLMGLLAELTR